MGTAPGTSYDQPGTSYDQRIICSSGVAAPPALPDDLAGVCARLHGSRSWPAAMGPDAAEYFTSGRVQTLIDRCFIKYAGGDRFRPAVMVITRGDAQRSLATPAPLLDDAVRLVADRLPAVRAHCRRLPGLAGIPFADLSLFILSDVLFDNWQIRNVERELIGRRARAQDGGCYISLFERGRGARDPLSIFGNAERSLGPHTVAAYGNETRAGAARRSLDALARVIEEGGENLSAPVLQAAEAHALREIAGLITDELLELLNRWMPYLKQAYAASPYAEEITFGEYYIWWYHLFFTAATLEMNRRGIISIPASRLCLYVIQGGSGAGAVGIENT